MKIQPITTKNNYAIYPASPSLLKTILTPEAYDNWLSKRYDKKDYISDKRLRDYQKEGVNKILTLKRCGVFDQQRLGKTPMVLSALKNIKNIKTLIVVPKSLLVNWKDECKKWYTDNVEIVEGSKANRRKIYNKNYDVLIISYMTIHLDLDLIPKIDCIIVDEAHRMRNFKGMQSSYSPISIKALMKKSYEANYKIAITGTPAPNKPYNIYPILHFLNPDLFTSYYKFIDYYFETEKVYVGRDQTIDEPVGFKKGKQLELQEYLDYISLQRKRIDYMTWLPPVDRKQITLSLDKEEQKWYNEIDETFECAELNINCANLLAQMIALRKITAKSKAKQNWILDYISDYPDESIIIASEFTSYLNDLNKIITDSVLLTGSTSADKRKQIENDFNNKKFHILLGNIQCIKEGMKLEQCNTIIVIDPSLTYTDNEQLEDRLLPTTKEKALLKDKQQILYLLSENSIDMYIRSQLDAKASYVDIINNYKKYLK